MAYFHCLIGGGSSGGGYELTVTCDSAFAGTTITCTDGTTTLTQTCPSSSPYEVVFEIPNGGDWTISGTTGGHTVSTGVSIPTSAELIATIQQTVTIYSAKEDTISYVDIDGATQTITFASGESSKQVTIEIEASGSSITFTSGVAKDPSDLTADYSKTVTITDNTTDVYLMPDGAIYWYGYEGYTYVGKGNPLQSGWTANDVTKNTNNISYTSNTTASQQWSAVWSGIDATSKTKFKGIVNSALISVDISSLGSNLYCAFGAHNNATGSPIWTWDITLATSNATGWNSARVATAGGSTSTVAITKTCTAMWLE